MNRTPSPPPETAAIPNLLVSGGADLSGLNVTRQRWWPGYVAAFAATIATLGIRLAMNTTLGGRPTLVIFTIPIMLSAYIGGLGPGLVATALSYLAASYYLLPQIHSFSVISPVDRWQQAFVVLAGVVISVLNEVLHRTRRHADQANAERKRAEATVDQLAAIVHSSNDAIYSTDLRGVLTSWNRGAEKTFGYSAAEIVGASVLRLLPQERKEEESHILAEIGEGRPVPHFDTVRLTKAGEPVDVSVTASPLLGTSGGIVGASKIVRDITAQKVNEREIARLTRLYSALSQVNQAIVVSQDREALFVKICRALVEHGGLRMAWIGLLEPETQRVHPAGQWGDKLGYVTQNPVFADDRPEGQGPVGTAIRESRTYVCNDFAADPRTLPWRDFASRAGYRASAVFPIRQDRAVCGAIAVYAGEVGFFKDREIALLEEAAGDVSFGLDNLARDLVRRKAEEFLHVSEERLRIVTENARVGLVTISPDRRYTYANAAYAEIIGRPLGEIIGHRVAEVTGGSYEQRIRTKLDQAFAGERVTYEAVRETPQGDRHFAVTFEPGMSMGEVEVVVAVITDFTERKRAEEAMLASEARYHALFEHAPDGIVIADPESTYLDANASACRMLGYTRKELIGLHATDIVSPAELPHIVPALDAIKAHATYHREWLFRRKDRSTFAAEVIATQLPDGNLLGMIRDITDRRQAEQAIRLSEEYFRFLDTLVEATRTLADPAEIMRVTVRMLGEHLHASRCAYADVEKDSNEFTILHDYTDGCATTVGHYQLSLFGPRAVATLGRGETLIIRDVAAELLPGEGAEMFRAIGIQAIITCPLVKEGGLRAMMAVHSTTPRNWKPGEITLVQDVVERCWATIERRTAEETVSRLNGVLEQRVIERTAQLEASNKELEAFSYSVSHDLRAPLRAMDGFSQAVLDDCGPLLPADGRRQLQVIRDSAQHMGELIDDLLAFSRLSRQPLRKERVQPGSLVRAALAGLPTSDPGRQIDINIGELPACEGDPALLKQVWVNLLSNALKYSGKRPHAVIEVGCREQQGTNAYFVRDNGTGFDMRYAHKLFGVFQRLHRAEDYEGTGVGLAIVQRVVQRHGGRVWAEAAPDRGATFYFTLQKETHP